MVDLGLVVGDILPYVSAAAGAYGGAVVKRVGDTAVDAGTNATVRLGRQLLSRLFSSRRGGQVQDAVRELGEQPTDEAALDLVRAQVRRALSDDPELAAELAGMLQQASVGGDRYAVTITESSGFQVGRGNAQTNISVPRPE